MPRFYLSTVYNIFISENLSIRGVAVMVKKLHRNKLTKIELQS